VMTDRPAPPNMALQRTAPCGLAAELKAFGGRIRPALAALFLLSVGCASTAAPTSEVEVKVTDVLQGALPGACVQIRVDGQPSTAWSSGKRANAAGIARFPNLSPGIYSVRASLSSFDDGIVTGIPVRAEGRTESSVSLKIARFEGDRYMLGGAPPRSVEHCDDVH